MGYNTCILILNDSLNEIEEDKDFGVKLSQSIMKNYHSGENEDIQTNHKRAGSVISSCHSSEVSLVMVGGNTSKLLLTKTNNDKNLSDEEFLLKALANKLGYKVSKKVK